MVYSVFIEEIMRLEYIIEDVDSEEEALEKAKDLYSKSLITLDSDDYVGTEFYINCEV